MNIEAGNSCSPKPAGNLARRNVAKLLRMSQQAFRMPEKKFWYETGRSPSAYTHPAHLDSSRFSV